jgi:RNA processing factor Prp31
MGNKMAVVAPNLGALIGDSVAARLISHAGSLTNLAKARSLIRTHGSRIRTHAHVSVF